MTCQNESRRQFIAALMGMGLSAYAPSVLSAAQRKKVVVVGAGFAGVGAALHLLKAGYEVEIIEAQGRLGGRAFSLEHEQSVIDLGAAWLHKGTKNPLYALAKQTSTVMKPTDFSDTWVSIMAGDTLLNHPLKVYDRSVAGLDKTLVVPYMKWQAATFLKRPAPRMNMTVLQESLSLLEPSLACVIRNLYEVSHANELEQLHVLTELGAAGHDPFGTVSSGSAGVHSQDFITTLGMEHFLTVLAKGLPISLNEAVQRINWRNDGVTLQTSQREIEADGVVVTSSIGLLKANRIGFSPRLPDSMLRALQGLDMGSVNKVILTFDEMVWKQRQPFIHFCDDNLVDFALNGPVVTGDAYFVGLASGIKAKQLEQGSDAYIAARFKQELEQALNSSLPEPSGIYVTRWDRDPWALGAYASINMQANGYEKQALRAPLGNKVFLAGEALSIHQPGTVNGAFYDGMRAADQLIRAL